MPAQASATSRLMVPARAGRPIDGEGREPACRICSWRTTGGDADSSRAPASGPSPTLNASSPEAAAAGRRQFRHRPGAQGAAATGKENRRGTACVRRSIHWARQARDRLRQRDSAAVRRQGKTAATGQLREIREGRCDIGAIADAHRRIRHQSGQCETHGDAVITAAVDASAKQTPPCTRGTVGSFIHGDARLRSPDAMAAGRRRILHPQLGGAADPRRSVGGGGSDEQCGNRRSCRAPGAGGRRCRVAGVPDHEVRHRLRCPAPPHSPRGCRPHQAQGGEQARAPRDSCPPRQTQLRNPARDWLPPGRMRPRRSPPARPRRALRVPPPPHTARRVPGRSRWPAEGGQHAPVGESRVGCGSHRRSRRRRRGWPEARADFTGRSPPAV